MESFERGQGWEQKQKMRALSLSIPQCVEGGISIFEVQESYE